MAGARRQHGTTVFVDPATLEPFEDQWACLCSISRLSLKQSISRSSAGTSDLCSRRRLDESRTTCRVEFLVNRARFPQ
ncbi:hypothetical protein [Nocardia sp. R6R-6]|uniref:hypothetical protein n=1 Tax=Nocardia sp. R6R-6 TaxID=3459303 RepID=UPI00403DFC13